MQYNKQSHLCHEDLKLPERISVKPRRVHIGVMQIYGDLFPSLAVDIVLFEDEPVSPVLELDFL